MLDFFFFKQKTAYEMRISDWSSDVCSSDLHDLITFNMAFHGRTIGTISATNQAKLRDGFDPLLPGFKYAEFNDLEGALALIDEHTAGFLVEPIQGEGGIRPATDAFLKGLRKACDEHRSEEHTSELQSLMRISYAV